MLRIIWRFRAKPHESAEFQRTYSGKGAWAKLFGKSPEYQGTILLQDVADPLAFVVIDRWTSQRSFDQFKEQFGPDYERLDKQCTDLTDEETLIGAFQEEVSTVEIGPGGDRAP